MRTKFKAWAEPYINEHKEVTLQSSDLANLTDYYLEIGSGKGQFLLNMALKFPQFTFVGVERNITCCGYVAKKLVENDVQNAKLIFDNIDRCFEFIKDKSVNKILLNFSDPWPKKKHAKRRLTSLKYLDNYFRILKDDGVLVFKTDNKVLFDFTIETLESSNFEIVEKNNDYKDEDDFDAVTEYEENFRELGQPIYRVILKKK